ncbi:PQQ-binding-like beta-propeller repeat protein [Pseudomonas aeruginosa]|uniref:outer membrane protein assembly factor BamB family protein n=1 Tax=Pseudomonas aeruginosa TaxID=287 RepID=UPI003748B5B7
MLYACTAHSKVLALDPDTGAEIWRFDPQIQSPVGFKGFAHMTCRGVSYYDEEQYARSDVGAPPAALSEAGKAVAASCPRRLFLPTADARLIAINADNGKVCEDFGVKGAVDLTAGIGPFTPGGYYSTSPAAVTRNLVIIGGHVTDNESTNEPSGVIRAFDVHDGKLVWNWDSGNPDDDRAPGSRQVLYPQLAEHVVAGQRRREARPGLPAAGQPDARPVGRQPHPRCREVQRRPGGPRPEHRQAALELPVHPPRPVGHGRRQPADPARPEDRRWRQAGADRADQAGQPVRAGPPRRHADRADPRSAGAAGRGGGRPYRADPGAFRPQPAAPAADRARHVGQQPVRPDALPHPVPLAALRGPVHPAVGAGQPDLSGQRRSVQLGRGVGRPGAPDPLHQPQLHGLRLADGAARQGAQRKQARGRDQRRAAEHRRALRGDHASVHVAHRPAVPGAVLG